MAKKKAEEKAQNPYADLAVEQFNIQEIYRLVHLEQIPGFQMLKKEREYLSAYRAALTRNYETETVKEEGSGDLADDGSEE